MKEEPGIVKELRQQEKLAKIKGERTHSSGYFNKTVDITTDSPSNMQIFIDDESQASRRDEYGLIDRALMGDERNRTLFDWSPAAIVIIDEQGILLDANRKLYEWLGYKPAEVIGKNILELPFFPKETTKIVRKNFILRMRGEDVPPYEVEFLHKNGMQKWGEIHGIQLRDDIKNVTLDLVMVNDVTKRKKMLDKLKESEEKFRSLAESANDAVILSNQKGIISYLNHAAEEIFGYSAEEIIGKPLTTIIPKRFHEGFIEGMKNISPHEKDIFHKTVELIGLKKDGSEFPSEISISYWKNHEGVFFTGIMRDITNRKKNEDMLKSSEKKFRNIFENANDLIQCVDTEGKFIEVNPKWLETLEYTKEEVKNLTLKDILREDQIPHCMEFFEKVCNGESVKNVETVFISKTGKEIFVEGNANGQFKDGRFVSTIGIFRDRNERKKTQ